MLRTNTTRLKTLLLQSSLKAPAQDNCLKNGADWLPVEIEKFFQRLRFHLSFGSWLLNSGLTHSITHSHIHLRHIANGKKKKKITFNKIILSSKPPFRALYLA